MADERQGGARLKDIPTSLSQVNDLVGDLTVKLGTLASTPQLQINTKPFESIERHMENIGRLNKRWGEAIGSRAKAMKDIANQDKRNVREIEKLLKREKELEDIEKKRGKLGQKKTKELSDVKMKLKDERDISKQILEAQKGMQGKWKMIGLLITQDVLDGVDKLGKSLITLSFDAVLGAIELLKKGFLAVYDLVDRTVKATGEFRDTIGATTTGLKQLEKEGWQLEGTLRSLSKAELGIGLKELGEATKAFGFADASLSKFRTTAVMAGKALGIGSAEAGNLARQFYLSGENGKDLETSFMDISRAANAAGVPVSEFSKEIGKSTGFMASFGKKARQVFLDSAAYARKYGLSIKSLEGFVDLTDTFEGTAMAAAKLNTIFGTSINAMELMLNDDPAQRLEMVRKALTSQGKSWDNLSRQERKFLAETTKISEDELQGLLTSKKTYADFQKDKERARQREISDQKAIQKATLMTAKTLNNWGQTFDRIAAAFKPLLEDVIGPDFWKNVGKNVGMVVTRIQEFFNMVRSNKDVQAFVKVLREDFGDLLALLTSKGKMAPATFEKIQRAISAGAKFFGKFYEVAKKVGALMVKFAPTALSIFEFMVDHAGTILGIFAGLKLLAVGGSIYAGVTSFIALLGGGGTIMAALGAIATALGGIIASAATAIGGFLVSIAPFALAVAGAAAALGAAALAGYAIGTALRKLFPQIDEFSQKMMDGVAGFFDNIWKKVVHTTFYKTLFGSEAAEAYDRADAQERAYQKALRADEMKRLMSPIVAPVRTATVASPAAVPTTVQKPSPTPAAQKAGAAAPAASKTTEVIQVNVNMDGQVAARAIVNRQKTQ